MLDLKKLEQQLENALALETPESLTQWLLNNRLEQLIATIHCGDTQERVSDVEQRIRQISTVLGEGEQELLNSVETTFEVPFFSLPTEETTIVQPSNFCPEAA